MRGRPPGILLAGAALVVLLSLAAVAAPLLTGADPATQYDPVAGRFLPPLSRAVPLRFGDGRRLLAERVERDGDRLLAERLGRRESYPLSELADLPADGVPRARRFLLGTDRYGRDVLVRLLHGARVSLAVALLSVAVALSLGVVVGAGAAMAGGVVDGLLMRSVDALLAIPRLFLLLAVVALFRPGVVALVLVIGGTAWTSLSRLVRAEVVSLKERDFVLAARGIGMHPLRILWVHLLPNALTPVLVVAGLMVGDVILLESSLSFLGFGIQPPIPSWGNMVADGTGRLLDAWWVATFPGLAIVLTVIAFNLTADGLRDALDPRR